MELSGLKIKNRFYATLRKKVHGQDRISNKNIKRISKITNHSKVFSRKRNLEQFQKIIKNHLILGYHGTGYKSPNQVETITNSEENKYPNVQDNPSISNVPPIINDQKELIILHLAKQVFNSDSQVIFHDTNNEELRTKHSLNPISDLKAYLKDMN